MIVLGAGGRAQAPQPVPALWTRGMDMVGTYNLLGVDVMTGHWKFTYRDEKVIANIDAFKGDFLAQNVMVREEALFDYCLAGASRQR